MREIDNIAAACGMRGFRYLRFAAPVIGAIIPAEAAAPEPAAEPVAELVEELEAMPERAPAPAPAILAAPAPRAGPPRSFVLLAEIAALSGPVAEPEAADRQVAGRPIRSVAARRRAAPVPATEPSIPKVAG